MTENETVQVFTGPRTVTPAPSERVFRHIILFKMYEGTSQEVIDEALRLMVAMCDTREVLRYEVGHSLDTRKGDILFEFVDFRDEAAFEAFKATPGHLEYAAFIRKHADWTIADYLV